MRFNEYTVPEQGASRRTVRAALGRPAAPLDDGSGRITDVDRRLDMDDNARWMSHTVLDMLTLGLWEASGVPIELVGRDIRTEPTGQATF